MRRIAAIAAGAGFIAGGVLVALFMTFATPRIVAATSPSPTPTPIASPSPTPKQASPAQKAISKAVSTSLASALSMSPADLHKALKQGTTVQVLASQKNLAQATVQSSFSTNLKSQLDPLVTAKTITSAQEQKTLTKYQSTIPWWDKVPGKH